MSIKDLGEKIKHARAFNALGSFGAYCRAKFYLLKDNIKIKEDLFIVLIIFFVGLISFGLGKLSVLEKGNETATVLVREQIADNKPAITSTSPKPASVPKKTSGMLVASVNGEKYYLPTCAGVSKIKEENKIWFDSSEEARAQGFTPAANCPGLK